MLARQVKQGTLTEPRVKEELEMSRTLKLKEVHTNDVLKKKVFFRRYVAQEVLDGAELEPCSANAIMLPKKSRTTAAASPIRTTGTTGRGNCSLCASGIVGEI